MLSIILWLPLYSLASGQAQDLTRGLTFINQGEILATNEYWTIAVNLDLEAFQKTADTVEQQLAVINVQIMNIGGKAKEMHGSLIEATTTEYRVVANTLEKVQRQLSNLKSIYPVYNSREKRGLLDVGGKALKFLFGTPDNDDLQALHSQIGGIQTIDEKVKNIFKVQASILNATYDFVQENKQSIVQLKQVSKLMEAELAKINSYVNDAVTYAIKNTNFILKIQTSLRIIMGLINNLQMSIQETYEAMNVASGRHLSPNLLNTDELYEILIEVQAQLPRGLSIVTTLNKHDLFTLYQTANVVVASSEGLFKIFVQVPLINELRKLKLYRVRELPVKVSGGLFMSTVPEFPYLAISDDGARYMEIDFEDLNNCYGVPIRICPPHTALKTRGRSCVVALFQGNYNLSSSLCDKRLVKTPDAVFYKMSIKGQWIYSVPEVVTARAMCPNTSPQIFLLNNTGVIRTHAGCEIYIDGNVLLPDAKDVSVTRINIMRDKQIFMPEFTPDNINELQFPTINTNMTLKEIDRLLETIPIRRAGISTRELEHLISAMNLEENQKNNNYWQICVVGVILASVIGVVAFKIGRRLMKARATKETEDAPDISKALLSLPDGRKFSVKIDV